jgi:hypothetical protein
MNIEEGASRGSLKVRIELKRVKKYHGNSLAFLEIHYSSKAEASDKKLIALNKRHSGMMPSIERMATDESALGGEKLMLESINISEVTSCVEPKGG